MNRETWKAQERDYAKKIHGKRIPVTGRSGSDVPDITSHTIVGEVKKSGTGKAVSLKTMKALRGIKKVGKSTGKIPVLFQAQRENGKRDVEHVVTMYLDDFMKVAKHLILSNKSHNELLESRKDLTI
tara:strand:- start:1015 stop:1395 length:381 start_codon:yes stop_codon:yes gene_type:complete